MKTHLFHHTKQEEHCPKCGSLLQIKQSKKGLFLGCSAYPACDYLKSLQPHTESKTIKDLEQTCPECGHFLQLKQGHFGMFIGCSHYPDCHFIVHEQAEEQVDPILCPECKQQNLIARRGRHGKTFYGCAGFPKCKFTLPAKPYERDCPVCRYPVCWLKKSTQTHRTWACANKTCRHLFETTI